MIKNKTKTQKKREGKEIKKAFTVFLRFSKEFMNRHRMRPVPFELIKIYPRRQNFSFSLSHTFSFFSALLSHPLFHSLQVTLSPIFCFYICLQRMQITCFRRTSSSSSSQSFSVRFSFQVLCSITF